jgi:L-arabinose isomerase
MGNRFRLLVNPCRVVRPETNLPKLPVARVLWEPEPNLSVAAGAWIYAGGAHHTGFSMALTKEHLVDFAEMAGIECLTIDSDTSIPSFKNELRWNEVYYHIAGGF